MSALVERLRQQIAAEGPLAFSAVMEAGLYDPVAGFYATRGQAGKRGDFITSPEVGGLFGAVVARALDTWWDELGQPPTFTVVEAGAGPGTLARSVRAAQPRCAAALSYVTVEVSDAQRALHPVGVEARATLPTAEGPCLVLANELLDNLPVDLVERTADGWAELRVTERAGELVGVLVPTSMPDLDRLVPDAAPGTRVPWQAAAQDWLRSALALAGPQGRVVVWDYGRSTAELGAMPTEEWLRTYRGHQRGGHPLEHLGEQDVTCEVAIDQLALVRPPSHHRTQAAWLRAHGIDDLVAAARGAWQERAAIGDLEALKARSRATEADALLDPAGLGGFVALEWAPGS
jgi:SAM-dependent MidA family methyltransferase